MVSRNLEAIEKDINIACEKSGRQRRDITLVAVSKNNEAAKIMEAYRCGCRDFGENRVQELVGKIAELPEDIRWHMIGRLQRNKVKYIIDKVALIHSVDSYRLAEEISREAVKRNITARILIEVNVAGEESKTGVRPEDTLALVTEAAKLPGLKIEGLMTIAPLVDNAENNRRHFARLKQLSVDITDENIDNTNMDILSMGMSGDFMAAIEEGAGMIRIGTGIFKN